MTAPAATEDDRPRLAVRILPWAAEFLLAVAVGMTLLPRLTVRWDVVAMAGSFAPYAIGSALLGVALLVVIALRNRARPGRRREVLLWLAGGVMIVTVLVAMQGPRFLADDRPAAGPSFTVAAVNLRLGEADPDDLSRVTDAADVVVLTEITEPVADRLEALGLTDRLPYALDVDLPTRGARGTMVYSRFPLSPARALMDGSVHQNWVTAVAVPEVGRVRLVAVHPRRPYARAETWLGEQRALRAALPRDPLIVVAGDFNAVPEHASMINLADHGLTSATDITGDGQLRTFVARGVLPPLIRIDHVLVGEQLTATSTTTLRVDGTDHLGLQAVVARRASGGGGDKK